MHEHRETHSQTQMESLSHHLRFGDAEGTTARAVHTRASLSEDRAQPAGAEARGQARAHPRALEGHTAQLPVILTATHAWLPGRGTQKT